jgi:hypothetical protein
MVFVRFCLLSRQAFWMTVIFSLYPLSVASRTDESARDARHARWMIEAALITRSLDSEAASP